MPDNVDLRATAKSAQPLSPSDKANLKATIENSNLVPGADLYLDDESDSTQKQADLAKLDGKGKAMIDRVKASCKISPKTTTTAQSVTTTVASIGDNAATPGSCPLSYSSKDVMTWSITNIDKDTNAMTGTMHDDSTSTTTYNIADYANVPLASSTSTSSVDFVYDQAEQNSDHTLKAGTQSSKYKSIQTGTVAGQSVLGEFRSESHQSVGHSDSSILVKMSGLPQLAPVILGIFKTDSNPVEIYLNGESYTADRLMQEIGIDATNYLK